MAESSQPLTGNLAFCPSAWNVFQGGFRMTCNQSLVLENISEAVLWHLGSAWLHFQFISSCSEAKKGQVQQLLNEYKVMHNQELRDIWVWLSENYRPAILGCLNTK